MSVADPSSIWPPAGSDMGELIRHMDWGNTALGPIRQWSTSLRIALASALDSPLPTVVLWGPDLIQLYNDAYRPLLGLRHPAAMGQATQACWPEVWHFNEPIYRRVLGTGERVHLEDQEYIIEPSGICETRYFTITYTPARDEFGTVCGVLVVARETTRRVLAERENVALYKTTRLAADQLRQMFDQAPSFMALLRGPDHIFEITNAAYMRLLGKRDVIGKSVRQTIPEAENQGFVKLLDEAYLSGVPFLASEMPVVLQDPLEGPTTLYLDFVYQPIKDADGNVCALFVQGNDVSEKKRVSDALARTDRRKDDFLAMLAHELRNPLAPIAMAAQILRRPHTCEKSIREMSEIIVRQAEHMTSLIEDLLDVSRINKGLVTLDRQVLDIKDIVVNAVEQVRSLMERRRHHFSMHMAADAIRVEGDRVRLVQVFSNVLTNAAKYTPEGGKITLEVAIADDQAKLTVSDNGAGIDSTLMPHIFEIFTQAERSADRFQGGLGLGLSLVKNLVELHGGLVTAKSAGLGMGSEFTICLPLLKDSSSDERERPPAPHAHVSKQAIHIMVVDDNVDAAKTVAMLLELDGHTVSVEHTAEKALKSAGAVAPQAFLLDIGLPGMDGYELARQLRASSDTANSLLIALTGYGQPQDHQKSKEAGFDHHFDKPIDPNKLLELLDRLSVRPSLARPRH